MSAFSNALSGQSGRGLSSILAQLNSILTPTEQLPGNQSPYSVVLGAPGASVHPAQPMALSPAGPSQPSSIGSLLQGGPNSQVSKLVKGLKSLMGTPISAADAATWASGAPANSAVSSALGSVGSQTAPEASSIQAANDAALASQAAGGLGSLASFASGAPADAAVAAQLGNVANDGTAAAVQASNDAALNATDGGAAGAAAGQGAGLASDASTALGALGAGYSLYNTVKNYQSGNTGSDALNGAETGASIGTMILPGIGTVIGGLLGGAGGAIASAFGGGENDPETLGWNKTVQAAQANPSAITGESPSQLYQNLAGMMDAKNNSPGHSTNLELHFGRMGEGSLMDQMAQQVNQAVAANPSLKNDSASQLYSSVVQPWLQKSGAYVNPNDIVSSNGTRAGSSVNNMLTGLLGDWMSGSINAQTPMGINGQTISGLANYAGLSPQQTSAMQPVATASPIARMLGSVGGYRRMIA